MLISEDVRRKEELRLERERRERELDRERETALLEVDANGEKRVRMPLALSRGEAKAEVTVRFGFPTAGGASPPSSPPEPPSIRLLTLHVCNRLARPHLFCRDHPGRPGASTCERLRRRGARALLPHVAGCVSPPLSLVHQIN